MEIVLCGQVLDIPDRYLENFESETELRNQLWTVHPGDVVMDIGASLGIYTLPALALGAYVLAVDVLEMGPLRDMARDNKLDGALTVIQCALGADDGYPGWLMDAVHHNDGNSYPGLADCVWSTVDNLAEEHDLDRLDWVKIDTEGGELPILLGAAETLKRFHPKLLIEEHSHMPHVAAAGSGRLVRALLESLGYGISVHPVENRELWFCEWSA